MKKLIYIIAGSIYALGFPSVFGESLLITPIIGLVILFNGLIKKTTLKQDFLTVLLFCLGFNLTGYYWIADTLTEFGNLPYFLALVLNSLFAFIVAPYLWAFIILKKYILKNAKLNNSLHIVCLAIIVTTFEFITPQQFDSFLGSPWIYFSKHLGFASIAGVSVYSFFSFILVFEVIRFLKTNTFGIANLLMIFFFIILNPLIVKEPNTNQSKNLNIRMVQANISNYLKVDSEKGTYASSKQVIEKYKNLSLKEHNFKENIDLIIWPETAYPYSIYTNLSDLKETLIPTVFVEIINKMNSQLFIGGYDSQSSKAFYQSDYNTAFHISKEGRLIDTYHKRILIPFGETLPFGPLNEKLSKLFTNIAFFATGKKSTLFKFNNGVKSIASICYEGLKPFYIRDYLNNAKDADLMINLTNDSWYGKTMEPFQHLFLTKWRALEFNLPILRSTNTGITSFIKSDGTESKRTELFKGENLDLRLSIPKRSPTIFQTFGFIAIFPFWIICLIFSLLEVKLKNE
ncbi:MAG: apolipoprotein N-acyltransferase [Bacteriovoracaceae bacterium]|jgi:apolipoprotein N-acyltransferase|nr:apolipoprotein N-acyltransferase [Bacteriovoracaceae bacterium]